MAAGSRFFKDQLCKQNVQVPVILRLEDFGIELKRDAVSYIIEFVYRGEVRRGNQRQKFSLLIQCWFADICCDACVCRLLSPGTS